jgi:multisubunit Na+/H+ antiporter MnhC subunit
MITFSKVSKTKINLIYAKMVKVLWYIGIFLDEGKNSPNIIIGMTIIGK